MKIFNQVFTILFCLFLSSFALIGQGKKVMTPDVFSKWRRINDESISDDGKFVIYTMNREQHDDEVVLYSVESGQKKVFDRGKKPMLTNDGKLLILSISPPMDSLREMKRRKVKKDDLPKDTLYVYKTLTDSLILFPEVTDVKKSKYYSEMLAFKMKTPNYKKDTIAALEGKKQSEENGNHLVIYLPELGLFDTIKYVRAYEMAQKSPILFAWTTGVDTTNQQQIIKYNALSRTQTVLSSGQYYSEANLFVDENGQNLGGVVLRDSTKSKTAKRELLYWQEGMSSPEIILDVNNAHVESGWRLPEYSKISFDQSGKRLFFSLAPIPMVQDTNLLEEEIVSVEVWHHNDPYMYTMQEAREETDKKQTYLHVYDTESKQFAKLADLEMAEIRLPENKSADYAIGWDERKYLKSITWMGGGMKDLYVVDLETGDRTLIADSVNGNVIIDSIGNHVIWFERSRGNWMHYDLEDDTLTTLFTNANVAFYDEENDVPASPGAYGFGGWISGRNAALIYDKYDIWMVDFDNDSLTTKLTFGRGQRMINRVVNLVSESSGITLNGGLYIKQTDEKTRDSGYAIYDAEKARVRLLEKGPFDYRDQFVKAKNANVYITTRENFNVFPDLLLTDNQMGSFKNISEANPQQSEYNWGSIELFYWENELGEKLRGLLVKPQDFDPRQKYPLLVNFYERSSEEVHSYRTPLAGRSSINYSYYSNKGYVIFNPDVTYRIGYPGPSCEEDVLSGVKALTQDGYIDTTRMGIQGHSWGGYQIAHLLTKTDIFKCAEAGAPVVNMTSAYGGIRWESGMSRMFQYEKTQSRIGATLWEKPELYLENSPLFNIDKVKTPVLIMHNDGDGAVPWYQGIEYYTALRRLGKETWLLNYNGEPHWPVKWQNRLDFNIRMEQYFDHYLMDKPMPQWMVKGIPALEKGINKGY
ncbi:MAG: S9 family peptidase [Saprospiraceae bacterium]|nr:S9 family peptidase [Saprospiraceae bacterium]